MSNMERTKYAVFTMDVESFTDTECISSAGMEFSEDMLDGLDRYMAILDRYGIKATMFSVCRTALAAKDRILFCVYCSTEFLSCS